MRVYTSKSKTMMKLFVVPPSMGTVLSPFPPPPCPTLGQRNAYASDCRHILFLFIQLKMSDTTVIQKLKILVVPSCYIAGNDTAKEKERADIFLAVFDTIS